MTNKMLTAAILVAGIFTVAVGAQSRSVEPRSNTKSNARPNERPTPAPENSNETTTEELGEVIGEVIRIETGLVTVPVRVVDRNGRFVGGLGQDDFRVFENGTEQSIEHFSNESQPFTVALVLDMSYSATFKIADIQTAAMAFPA